MPQECIEKTTIDLWGGTGHQNKGIFYFYTIVETITYLGKVSVK